LFDVFTLLVGVLVFELDASGQTLAFQIILVAVFVLLCFTTMMNYAWRIGRDKATREQLANSNAVKIDSKRKLVASLSWMNLAKVQLTPNPASNVVHEVPLRSISEI
jgi:hypothetical protein